MAIQLTQAIQNQITKKAIGITFSLLINKVEYGDFIINWSISNDKKFGAASASFTLDNNSGIFGYDDINEIKVGDTVEFIEQYKNDNTQFKRFYGLVTQRSINKTNTNRTITLTCLDYISTLQYLDIDLKLEGTKVKATNEILTPNFLPAPNDSMAQIFDFANKAIAQVPPPVMVIKDRNNLNEDPQFDGFEIIASTGQV